MELARDNAVRTSQRPKVEFAAVDHKLAATEHRGGRRREEDEKRRGLGDRETWQPHSGLHGYRSYRKGVISMVRNCRQSRFAGRAFGDFRGRWWENESEMTAGRGNSNPKGAEKKERGKKENIQCDSNQARMVAPMPKRKGKRRSSYERASGDLVAARRRW